MAVDRSAIDAQLGDIGEGAGWWDEQEFRDLPVVLNDGERIRGLARGRLLAAGHRSRRPPGGRRSWLFVATDRRLVCLQEDGYARRQIDIEKEEISRVSQRSGLKESLVTVDARNRRHEFRIPRFYGPRFFEAAAALLPEQARRQLPREVEAFAWIPGITRVAELPVVSQIITRVAMLSPPDPRGSQNPRERQRESELVATVARLQEDVDRLQSEVDRLQQSVGFLETLLGQRYRDGSAPILPPE